MYEHLLNHFNYNDHYTLVTCHSFLTHGEKKPRYADVFSFKGTHPVQKTAFLKCLVFFAGAVDTGVYLHEFSKIY